MENGPFNIGDLTFQTVIFHSYVSLTEGTLLSISWRCSVIPQWFSECSGQLHWWFLNPSYRLVRPGLLSLHHGKRCAKDSALSCWIFPHLGFEGINFVDTMVDSMVPCFFIYSKGSSVHPWIDASNLSIYQVSIWYFKCKTRHLEAFVLASIGELRIFAYGIKGDNMRTTEKLKFLTEVFESHSGGAELSVITMTWAGAWADSLGLPSGWFT